MSLCKDFGKDKVIFATKEDHSTPSTVKVKFYIIKMWKVVQVCQQHFVANTSRTSTGSHLRIW